MLERRKPRAARIGVFGVAHPVYWNQFPGLYEQGIAMNEAMVKGLEKIGDVIQSGLVDTAERGFEAAELFKKSDIDILAGPHDSLEKDFDGIHFGRRVFFLLIFKHTDRLY